MVLPHNAGFCNGCITKRILFLQAFHSQENQYYADYYKKYYIFHYFNLLPVREVVKLDQFMTLSLSYVKTVLWSSHCKIHRFVAAPFLLRLTLSFLGSVLLRERYEGAEPGVQSAAPAGDGQAGGGRVPARKTGHRLKSDLTRIFVYRTN